MGRVLQGDRLGRQPLRAREVVILAVMITFCVLSNEVCAHTLPLHAGTTMVVISGIALGPGAGFVIGSLSRFICNFFDGQGPWTVWQMASWGLIGSMAGVAFNRVQLHSKLDVTLAQQTSMEKARSFGLILGPVICVLLSWILAYVIYVLCGAREAGGESFFGWRLYAYGVAGLIVGCLLQRKRLPVDEITLTVFTFGTVFIIYGGIMNFSAMVLSYFADSSHNALSLATLRALYITGAPYDAAHAGGAALCMFLFGRPLLEKIQRVQIKFGIVPR